MMTFLAEQPLMLSILLAVTAAMIGYGYLQSGDKRAGIAALVCGLLIPVVWLIAANIQTDREKILTAIDETAAAVQANDAATAVQIISDPAVRTRAEQELPRYDFSRVNVRNVQIQMLEGSFPPTATVDLDASVTASMKSGGLQNVRVPRRVILTFEKQTDGRWLVTDYDHRPLVGGPDAFSPQRI
ncbi:hypothetical protein [Stieleria varia]|uniref:DUF4440 domain-containing protein n=1 Tax=Stieleria varia TaxID=2528005 RepID=A0A5C6B017_9BACT|nr:hypothetical protein [Stieleria varia]TWU04616.1 hypothetical protein Pla52n_26580 [Stieleria varia]